LDQTPKLLQTDYLDSSVGVEEIVWLAIALQLIDIDIHATIVGPE
jgi:hypothetical protein